MTDQVNYKGTDSTTEKTPLLTSLSPKYGTVLGGTNVTFVGTGFSSTTSEYTVTIDGIDCPVHTANTTHFTCTTGKRPGLVESSLVINIASKGYVSTQGIVYTYSQLWSDDTTWGGEYAPIEGESIHIPKGFNLVVDVDRTDELNAIIVEGKLTFPSNDTNHDHHRTFDARYIFVHHGELEIGTKENPYLSKLTITMFGNSTDPYLPIYGNKVIGISHSNFTMHGKPRFPTWTMLDSTAP